MRASLIFGLVTTGSLVNPAAAQPADLAAVEQSKLAGIRTLVEQCRPLPPLPMSNPANPTPLDKALADANARATAQAFRTIQQRLAANGTTGFATEAGAAEYKRLVMQLAYCYYGQQIDRATAEAIRGGVGSESSWASGGDVGIAGRSKVTSGEKLADGSECLTVTDVIIVDGEETTVSKRMCRAPGASAYVKA